MCAHVIRRTFFAGALASALVCALAASAMASNISQIEAMASGTAVTVDSNPVVTAICSQPGTFGGHTYTSWSFLAQDGTGSMDVYGTMPGGYTPTVGDAIGASGTYSPYHQLPELETLTAIGKSSSGNAVPSPLSETIPQVNQTTLPLSIAGYLVKLSNVTISGASGNFPAANTSYTITDGVNSMTMYYWYTSYSTDGALSGTPIPTGAVDITGFASVYPGTPGSPEFIPIAIAPHVVPEPGTFVLLAAGGLCALLWGCWVPEIVAFSRRRRTCQ